MESPFTTSEVMGDFVGCPSEHGDDFSGPVAAWARGKSELIAAALACLIDVLADVRSRNVFAGERCDGHQNQGRQGNRKVSSHAGRTYHLGQM